MAKLKHSDWQMSLITTIEEKWRKSSSFHSETVPGRRIIHRFVFCLFFIFQLCLSLTNHFSWNTMVLHFAILESFYLKLYFSIASCLFLSHYFNWLAILVFSLQGVTTVFCHPCVLPLNFCALWHRKDIISPLFHWMKIRLEMLIWLLKFESIFLYFLRIQT